MVDWLHCLWACEEGSTVHHGKEGMEEQSENRERLEGARDKI